jgi:hypothetical protein
MQDIHKRRICCAFRFEDVGVINPSTMGLLFSGWLDIQDICLFLFLLPAILGAQQALRNRRISYRVALLLAATITVLMISAWNNQALWIHNWALVLPVWYLVAKSMAIESRTALRPIDHAGI